MTVATAHLSRPQALLHRRPQGSKNQTFSNESKVDISPIAACPSLARSKSSPTPYTLCGALLTPWALIAMGTSVAANSLYSLPWLVFPRLAASCGTMQGRIVLLGVFAGSQIVLIPFMSLVAQQASVRLQRSLVQQSESALMNIARGRTALWTDQDLASACRNELTSQGEDLALQTSQFLTSFAGNISNLSFGVWQIATLCTPETLAALGVAVGISYCVGQICATARATRAEQMRTSDATMQLQAESFWDNMVLGNSVNELTYSHEHNTMLAQRKNLLLRASWLDHLGNQATSAGTNVLNMLISFAYLEEQHFGGQPRIITPAWVARLRGLSQISFSLPTLANLNAQRKTLEARLLMRIDLFSRMAEPIDLRGRIHPTEVTVTGKSGTNPASKLLADMSVLKSPGLWTVRGPNGSGKTTLLLLCKQAVGPDALLIPAQHRLSFGVQAGSSGQTVRRIFETIDTMPKRPSVLLLDEWDAHLDNNWRFRIRAMIDRWQKDTTVVEIVHR